MADKNMTASTNTVEQPVRNYNEANIADVRKIWAEEDAGNDIFGEVYTLVQTNAPCEVTITKESRKACVKALLR